MEKGIGILMAVVLGLCMVASPIMLLLQCTGAFISPDPVGTAVFALLTLADVVVLILWGRRWSGGIRAAVWGAILVVLILCLTLLSIERSLLGSVYDKALEYVEADDYRAALDLLQPYSTGSNPKHYALFCLCRSHLKYEKGEIEGARDDIVQYNHLMPERARLEGESGYIDEVTAAYDDYREEERRARERAYELSIIKGVPFVGMPESRIDDTSLGKHSGEIRHNNEMVNGDVLKANLYDFVRNGRRIFTARCVNGTVTQVWDRRDEPVSSYTPPRTKKSGAKEDDPYNAADYHDPEDFYDDYYDDFFEYEEAEEYYYDHAG